MLFTSHIQFWVWWWYPTPTTLCKSFLASSTHFQWWYRLVSKYHHYLNVQRRKMSRSCCPGSIITNNGNHPPVTCSFQPQGFFSPIISPISPASFLWLSLSHEICVLLWIMHKQSLQMNICWINKWIGYFLITFFLNFFSQIHKIGVSWYPGTSDSLWWFRSIANLTGSRIILGVEKMYSEEERL